MGGVAFSISEVVYSKVNKSKRVKVAVIFTLLRFSEITFCVVATIKI
jgi:hypothetical protein